ncbi:protein modification by small protein conjugation or removal [Tieghemiomyces parasiticus]|uniref:Protein modification by small protein conjugation or removal n=1 Tax=Tieghemiomyces parasiticus TaxID=78921 RepID=A0A9W8AGQ6_9FUNG|nr:protein modification by small protein conjugation or removal [Tieghemiomyces parasiticus]
MAPPRIYIRPKPEALAHGGMLTEGQRELLHKQDPRDTPEAQAAHARARDQPAAGYLSAKQALHVEPCAQATGPQGRVAHTVGYNPSDDAYYENARLIPLAQGWRNGVHYEQGIHRKLEYDHEMVYLAREPRQNPIEPAVIEWKLNFFVGGFYPTRVRARLASARFSPNARVMWFARPLRSGEWQRLDAATPTELGQVTDEFIELTPMVATEEYGFVLRARLECSDQDGVSWQKTQLFRQPMDSGCQGEAEVKNLGLEICTDLRPDVARPVVPPPAGNLEGRSLNDTTGSDLTLVAQPPQGSDAQPETFAVHADVVGHYSAHITDQQSGEGKGSSEVKLVDTNPTSVRSMLAYMYDQVASEPGAFQPPSEPAETWALLDLARRYAVTGLTEACEQGLRGQVTVDNADEFGRRARDLGARQLARYCELFPFYHDLAAQEHTARQEYEKSRLAPRHTAANFVRSSQPSNASSSSEDVLPGQTMRGPAFMNRK